MSDPAEMAERHGRILGELSELGLALARDLQARALAADDAATAAEVALAFHRISRSVRQTLALEARLERDRKTRAREDREADQRDREARVKTRKAQVRKAFERLIWDEYEDCDPEFTLIGIDDLLDKRAESDAFLEGDVAAQVERLCADLGLDDHLDPPDPAAEPAEAPAYAPLRRSSA